MTPPPRPDLVAAAFAVGVVACFIVLALLDVLA